MDDHYYFSAKVPEQIESNMAAITKNYEVVECVCGNQTAVLKKEHVVDYTCSSCYSK